MLCHRMVYLWTPPVVSLLIPHERECPLRTAHTSFSAPEWRWCWLDWVTPCKGDGKHNGPRACARPTRAGALEGHPQGQQVSSPGALPWPRTGPTRTLHRPSPGRARFVHGVPDRRWAGLGPRKGESDCWALVHQSAGRPATVIGWAKQRRLAGGGSPTAVRYTPTVMSGPD